MGRGAPIYFARCAHPGCGAQAGFSGPTYEHMLQDAQRRGWRVDRGVASPDARTPPEPVLRLFCPAHAEHA